MKTIKQLVVNVSSQLDLNYSADVLERLLLDARNAVDAVLDRHLYGISVFGFVRDAPLRERVDDVWEEHPDFSRFDWKDACWDGETNLGYWEWVEHLLERRADEDAAETDRRDQKRGLYPDKEDIAN